MNAKTQVVEELQEMLQQIEDDDLMEYLSIVTIKAVAAKLTEAIEEAWADKEDAAQDEDDDESPVSI